MVRSARSISQQTCRQTCGLSSREPVCPGMRCVDILQVPLAYLCIQSTVLVLESYACQDQGSNFSLPRQYSDYHDGLRDLKFNYAPENRISVGIVNSCIEVRIFYVLYIDGTLSNYLSQVTRLRRKIPGSKSCTTLDHCSSKYAVR